MLKKKINFKIKYTFLLYRQKFKKSLFFQNTLIDSSKNQAYIFLAADYGNLGDVAITYAQTCFLRENTDFQVVEIPISQSLEGFWFVRRNIKKDDIVTIVGGGNMGDLYDQIEFMRQLTIRFFPKNKIISFPQTFDFSETKRGEKALKIARKVYNRHRNLIIVARENTSFKLMQKNFPSANVLLTPDIVLSLDKTVFHKTRKGVLICMRQDAEKSLTKEQNDFIVKTAQKYLGQPVFYDTHIGKSKMSVDERENELNKIWSAFKSAELVITDRLHGMIFCHITGTPALVFQNNNHKVRETYEWIKENTSVTLHTSYSEEGVIAYFRNKVYGNFTTQHKLKESYYPIIEVLE